MNTKKIFAMLLALAMLLSLLSGCGQSEETATDAGNAADSAGDAVDSTGDAQENENSFAEVDALAQAVEAALAKARTSHDPDEVVCTIDGQDVTWEMFYYLLSDELMTVIYYTGGLPEDYTKALTEEMTLEQYLKETTLAKAKYYVLAHTQALERDLSLSEEQEQEIEDYMTHLVEQYGSEEALQEAMTESNLSSGLLRSLLRSNTELTALMDSLYGAAGEKMSQEDVLNWAAEQGYIHIKHILYYNYNDDGTEMDEEGKAAQKEKAQAALEELRAIQDNAVLAERFHEKMNADSGDVGGLMQFQNGYTFTSGTMFPVFEEAAFALEEYALSEVVETQSGYHIILRLPLDTEDVTMNQDSNTGMYMTLRQSAANDLFSRDLAGWMEQAVVEWSGSFENLDLNELFGAAGSAEE